MLSSAAGSAFCKAARLHMQLQNKHDCATSFIDAGNAYKKADPNGELTNLARSMMPTAPLELPRCALCVTLVFHRRHVWQHPGTINHPKKGSPENTVISPLFATVLFLGGSKNKVTTISTMSSR